MNRVINSKGVWLLTILVMNRTKENEQTVPHCPTGNTEWVEEYTEIISLQSHFSILLDHVLLFKRQDVDVRTRQYS